MNTSEVVAALADHWDMSKAEARRLLDVILHTFNDNLARGKSFTIPELGTFGTHTREKRRSFNPHYEKYMLLPPKRVVDFTPSKGLKEEVKNLKSDDE